jgi:hypothetical protein
MSKESKHKADQIINVSNNKHTRAINRNSLRKYPIFPIVVGTLVVIAIAIILSFNSINQTPDIAINVNLTQQSYSHISQNILFINSFSNTLIPSFTKTMYFSNNLSIRNYESFSPKDTLLSLLQINKPTPGDDLYFTLYVKNDGNAFSSYVEFILTDDNGYVLGDVNPISNSFSTNTKCSNYPLSLGPSQDKAIFIKVNTSKYLNNGDYKIFALFYKLRGDASNSVDCNYLVDSQNTFYAIIPFTLHQDMPKILITAYLVVLITILSFFIIELPKWTTRISGLLPLAMIKSIIQRAIKNIYFWSIIFALIVTFLIFSIIL